MRRELVEYVTEHFHQKECGLFVPKPDQVGNGKKLQARYIK